MSLQFIFGNSGSGKSDFLYDSVLKQAKENKEQQFLIIVPEQFTMQTQRELVERQKQHAIMNVDVLSFARLAYRVFDDLGKQNVVVLEETGKNLVLRKVAEQKKAELKVLGANMNKMGYVGEVKSLISELMQYNVRPDALAEFLEKEPLGEGLRLKMQDVLTMYQGFTEYLKGRYITAEEVLELLYDVAEESELLRNSVIVLDEFTGFTPIQNRLMEKLLVLAKKVSVSVTMDVREDFYQCRGVHELFAMSKKTVASLLKVAELCKVPVEEPLVLPTGKQRRYANAADLYFMEQNLFRPGAGSYRYKAPEQSMQHIRITSLKNPREELKFAAREIVRLTRENGYRYRDIAVVTGDVQQYGNYVPEIFEQYHIPYFIDQTKNILFHPFIECIRAILEMIEYDFSYESVFRFLRCGLAARVVTEAKNSDKEPDPAATEDLTQQPETGSHGLTEQEIDRLENYVLARGIRGASRWSRPWTFVMPDGTLEDMEQLNKIREAVYENFKPLLEAFRGKDNTVSTQTYELYSLIRRLDMEQLLKERGNFFEAHGNQARAKEYDQIYKIVMDLLYVRFLCFGNGNLVAAHDDSDGFWRRQILITVKDRDPARVDDPFLIEKLSEELPGILLWMLEGLKRLLANNYQFIISERSIQNLEAAMADSDNLTQFMQATAYVRFKPDTEERSTYLYRAYTKWCEDNLESPVPQKKFSQFLLKNAGKYGLTFSKHIFGLLLRVRSGRPLHISQPTRVQLNRSCAGSGEVQRRHAYGECPQKFRQTDP